MSEIIHNMLSQSAKLFQAGKLDEADKILTGVLRVEKNNFHALYFLGLVNAAKNNHAEAVKFLKKAFQLNMSDVGLQCNLALALSSSGRHLESLPHYEKIFLKDHHPQGVWTGYANSLLILGRLDEALDAFNQALLKGDNPTDALVGIGSSLLQLKRVNEALAVFEKVLNINPDSYPAWLKYAISLNELRRYDDAIVAYEKALAINPASHEAWSNIGVVYKGLRRYDDALVAYEKALAINPASHETLSNLGFIFKLLKRYEDSIEAHDQAIAIKHDFDEAWSNRGATLNELRRYDEALASYKKALEINPQSHKAWSNLGMTLNELRRHDEGLAAYDKALDIKPDFYEAWSNRGATLSELGRHHEAIAAYENATKVNATFFNAHWNESLSRLALGQFELGWEKYESRWKFDGSLKLEFENFPYLANLNGLAGKKILVWSEQGLGDTIQFCRYLFLLSKLDCELTFRTQEPLFEILEKSLPCRVVVAIDPLEDFDYQLPLLSLPRLFGCTYDSILAEVPYLLPDANKVSLWSKRLESSREKLKVGIVWSGGFRQNQPELWSVNERRNLPFNELMALKGIPVDFFSLQKGEPAEGELALALVEGREALNLINWTGELKNFSDTAAFIECLDLVISVDTSVAHLAGALGKPVWILNRFDACWRWFLNRADSPWYPTALLYKQNSPGDWAEVMANIKENLIRLANQGSVK